MARQPQAKLAAWERLLTDLGDLLSAGIDIDRSLAILQERSGHTGRLAQSLRVHVQAGEALSRFLQTSGCPILVAGLVRTGEATGELDIAVHRASGRLTDMRKRRERIQSLLAYPVCLGLLCAVVVYLLAAVVLPNFQRMFASFHLPLSPLTEFAFAVAALLAHGAPFVVCVGPLLVGLAYVHRMRIEDWIFRQMLRSRKTRSWAQVARSRAALEGLSVLLSGGIDLLAGMRLLVAANDQSSAGWAVVAKDVEGGERLSSALGRWSVILPAVVELMRIAEETGGIEEGARRAYEYVDRAYVRAMERLVRAVEPVATLFLGAIVAAATLFLMLPMLDLVKQLS